LGAERQQEVVPRGRVPEGQGDALTPKRVRGSQRAEQVDVGPPSGPRRFEPAPAEVGAAADAALQTRGSLERHWVQGTELSGPARWIKRAFDLIGAMLIILLTTPVWLAIALLIKLDSPGPIFFRQRRVGRSGRHFEMLKFRTMVDGADARKPGLLHMNEAGDGLFKIYDDPRVTRVGRWLRSTWMDELPQLMQVVTGKMSLVGPRPLVPDEDAQITGDARGRLAVRPGLTGPWQARGAKPIPIDEMAELDCNYIEHWSVWLDVKLIAMTAWNVLLRRGA
jgi:lipopolysaccharide/colanic/teichoic acid biosynthesis glycosyltransferase